MQGVPDEVWEWSERVLEVVERWLREPPADAFARWDWPKHKVRLIRWLREVAEARDLYMQQWPERLCKLHEYWRAIAPDDATEQVRQACETYHQFHSVRGKLSGSE